jgi:AsmA protein
MTDRLQDDLSDIWEDGPPVPRQAAASSPRRSVKPKSRRARPPPRPRWRTAVGYGALALGCVCAAAIAFLLVAAPVDLVRDRIIDQVKARTGRDLTVAGATSLSFFPRLAVALSDVSLSPPEGMEAPPTLIVPTVEAEIRPWSLLTAQPTVERITLHRPIIELSVDAQGGRSWDFADRRSGRGRPAPESSDGQQPAGEPLPVNETPAARAFSRFGAGSVRIVDGTVRYNDHGSEARSEVEALNLTLAADNPAGPLKINGALVVRGTPLTISGSVMSMQSLLSNQLARLAFKVSGAPFEATYEGAISLAAGLSVDGTLKLQAASARALGDWLGRPLPSNEDRDAVAVSTELKATQSQVTLSNLQASIGPYTMAGSLVLDTHQQRRRLSGNLQVSDMDFGKLLAKPKRNGTAASVPSAPSAAVPPVSAPSSKRGRDRGWSDDPINLSILGLLDANLTVSAQRLIHKEIKTGPARFTVALEGGIARFALEQVELYGGRARGLFTLDGSGDVLVASNNLILDHVALRPLLADALQFPWLEGSGKIYLELAGQGLTEHQIVESLNGKIEVASSDGAIIGLDIGKILRGLQRARLPNLTPSPDEKTPFSELAGTFTVTNGVAKNQDLRLVSTHLQLSGEGSLALGPRQIDYTIRTKIGGGTPDPDATLKVGTLEVPVSIVGPWEKPNFGIKGQEELTGAVKQIGKNLKSKEVRDALRGLLQGDGEKRVKPRDLIEKLLKKD